MTSKTFRKLALEIPGAEEREHMNHPDFRVEGKIFATLAYPSEEWGMVRLTPEEQQDFVAKAPNVFRPCNGVWGERGATNVRLSAANVSIVRDALKLAAKNIEVARSESTRKTGVR